MSDEIEPGVSLSIGDLFDVRGRRAVVTGGSRGIGRMVAEGLVTNGADVLIVARTAAELDATTADLAAIGACTGVVADVSTQEGRAAVVAAASARGGLDILVNNAGTAVPEPLGHAGPDASAAMLALNVTAPFLLTQALLPLLGESAAAERPSNVVMIGSIDGVRVPAAPLFSYGASKAGLHALTRELAHSVAGDHITVNAIAPGMFESAMTAGLLAAPGMQDRLEATIPAGRIGAPSDIAAAVLFLTGRSGAYLTGAIIPVDGGVSTHG